MKSSARDLEAYICQQSKQPEFADVTGIWDGRQHVAIVRTSAEHKYIFGRVPSPGFPPAGKVLLVPVVVVQKPRSLGPTTLSWDTGSSDVLGDLQRSIDALSKPRAEPKLVTEEELKAALVGPEGERR